ncbi:hypothetical protein PGB90_008997 [Kerria lacca]
MKERFHFLVLYSKTYGHLNSDSQLNGRTFSKFCTLHVQLLSFIPNAAATL